MKNSKFKFSKILLYSRILCSKISKYEVLIVELNPISEDAFASNLRVSGAMSHAVTHFA